MEATSTVVLRGRLWRGRRCQGLDVHLFRPRFLAASQ